ncbi:MAG: response regulator [Candidatus Marinimicrobia bacterium]|nr:response regulator [Candidatus Neomarinimicrobiota bacterium]
MAKKRAKILVVDDENFLRNFWETKLDPTVYEVIKAANGLQGIAVTKARLPDLILLDIIMPGVSGFKVLQELKKNPKTKGIPIIMLSNIGKEDEVKKALKLGAIDYIIKSDVIPQEVEEKIRQYLKKKI